MLKHLRDLRRKHMTCAKITTNLHIRIGQVGGYFIALQFGLGPPCPTMVVQGGGGEDCGNV